MNTNFKSQLEKAYYIIQWNPTEEQLLRIAKFIIDNPNELRLVSSYIGEICSDISFYSAKGFDNSDLNYLIAIAIKVVKEAD